MPHWMSLLLGFRVWGFGLRKYFKFEARGVLVRGRDEFGVTSAYLEPWHTLSL